MKSTLLRKAIRDISKRKIQFLALAVILVLGIVSYVGTLTAYKNLYRSYRYAYRQLSFADYTVQTLEAPQQISAKLKEISGVRYVEERLILEGSIRIENNKYLRSRLIGINTERPLKVNKLKITEGENIINTKQKVCLLEERFAKNREIEIGEWITVFLGGKDISLKVAGYFASPEYLIISPSKSEIFVNPKNFAVIFAPLKQVQNEMGLSGNVNNFCFIFENNVNAGEVSSRIERKLSPYGIVESYTQKEQPSNEALRLDLEGYREIAYFLPLLLMTVAVFSVYISLSRIVSSQRKEIGLMKALGVKNSSILALYLSYALILAIVSLIFGIALGQAVSISMTNLYAGELGIPMIETSYYPFVYIQALIISLTVGVLSGILPSKKAVSFKPAIAMRTEPSLGVKKSKAGFFESLISKATFFPFSLRMALRNLIRVRRRTLYTVIGLSFSFVLMISSWSFIDSMNWMLDYQINTLQKWDVQAIFDTSISKKEYQELYNLKGVDEVEPAVQIPAEIKSNNNSISTVLMGFPSDTTMKGFNIVEGSPPGKVLSDGKVYITPYISEKINAEIGNEIIVSTPFNEKTFTIGGLHKEFLGSPTITGNEKIEDIFGKDIAPNTLNITLKENLNNSDKLVRFLYEELDATNVMEKREVLKTWQELMGFFYIFFGILIFFAAILGFVVVFNTLTVSIYERGREFATMRTLGESNKNIIANITVENLISVCLSAPIGIILGILVSKGLMKVFNSELFTMEFKMYWHSYVAIFILILFVSLLSEYFAARKILRMDLAETTKAVE